MKHKKLMEVGRRGKTDFRVEIKNSSSEKFSRSERYKKKLHGINKLWKLSGKDLSLEIIECNV